MSKKSKERSAAFAAAVIRRTADSKRNADHATDELIEEVQIPGWAMVAFQTNRPQLLAALTPKGDMAEADVTLLVNLIRVVMETNQSLRQRYAQVEEKLTNAQAAVDGAMNGIRDVLNNFRK